VSVWVPCDSGKTGMIYGQLKASGVSGDTVALTKVVWEGSCNEAQSGSPTSCFDDGSARSTQMYGFITIRKNDAQQDETSFWENVNYKMGGDGCETYPMTNKATTTGTAIAGNAKTQKGDIESSQGVLGTTTTTYNLAYNTDYYLKDTTDNDGTTTTQCYDQSLKSLVGMSYTLFLDTAGSCAQLTQDSGFEIERTVDDDTYTAYIGYHGIHFFSSEASSQFTNGATVQKISFSSEGRTTADYTYKSVGGRLNKVTSQSTTLGALKGVPLYYWNEESNQQTRISWSGSELQMTGYQENHYFKMVNPPKTFTVTKRNARSGLRFYSDALGGDGMLEIAYVKQCTLYGIPSAEYNVGQIIKQYQDNVVTAEGEVLASVVKLTGPFTTGIKSIHFWGSLGDATDATIVIAAPSGGGTAAQAQGTVSHGHVEIKVTSPGAGYGMHEDVSFTINGQSAGDSAYVDKWHDWNLQGTTVNQGAGTAGIFQSMWQTDGSNSEMVVQTSSGDWDTSTAVVATYTNADLTTISITLGTPASQSSTTSETTVKVTSGQFIPRWKVTNGVAFKWDLDGTEQTGDSGPWWASDEMGDVDAQPTSSTVVKYQTDVVVTPGVTVPALGCYDNCIDPTKLANNSPDNVYFPAPSVLRVDVTNRGAGYVTATVAFSGGECTVAPTGTVEIESGSVNGITITSHGTGCTEGPTATITKGATDSVTEVATANARLEPDADDTEGATAYGQLRDYTWDSANTVLKYDGTAVTYNPSNSEFSGWRSANTDILFEATTANKAKLVCDWDTTRVCPWKARDELSEYYRWSTGPQSQLASLVDANGAASSIDAPKTVQWQVPANTSSNSGVDYSGSSLFLRYEGAGRLEGFPEFCVSTATGKKADCSEDTEWMPDISMPAGSTVTTLGTSPVEYAVKAAEYKVLYATTANSACTTAGLTISTDITLPTESSWTAPTHSGDAVPTNTSATDSSAPIVRVTGGVCTVTSECTFTS